MTHYLPQYSVTRYGRDEQALCGALVPHTAHAYLPDCVDCYAALRKSAIAIGALRDDTARECCADCGQEDVHFKMWWVPFGTQAICADCRQHRIKMGRPAMREAWSKGRA